MYVSRQVFARTAPLLLQKAPVGPRAAFDKSCREVLCVCVRERETERERE